MGNISKLPKWAQGEVQRLNSNAEYWRRKYEEAVGVRDLTARSAKLVDYEHGDLILPDARILYPHQGIELSVDNEGRLSARAVSGNGVDIISIYPSASNCVYLRGAPYTAARPQ